MDGRCAEFTALCDSGNLASDPLSARPAILADVTVLRPAVPGLDGENIPDYLMPKIRMIPVKGVGGGGVFTGFIPDCVWICTDGREKKCDAVIAVTALGSTFFGGYPANAPASLI